MSANPTFAFTLDDPHGQVGDLRAGILQTASAAGTLWSYYLNSSATVDVRILIDPVGSTSTTNAVNVPVATQGGSTLTQVGASYELATGVDPNGADPDITIRLDPNFARALFYDPTPGTAGDIPANRIDGFSVLLRELADGLGFEGLRNAGTGALAGGTLNTYDANVAGYLGGLGFFGATTQAVYGGPVPLTNGNYDRYGNVNQPPGVDPLAGLMNGVAVYPGVRYALNDLDLAILTDVGTPILVRRPGTDGADHVVDGPLPAELNLFGGDDTAFGGAGNDIISGGAGSDLLFGNQGADTILGGADCDTVFGGQGNDQIFGNGCNDLLLGNLGDDLVFGGAGNDTLFGGQGNDVLSGDTGDDVLSGDLGADRFVFGAGSGADLIVGFSLAQGDRIDLQGQGYTLGSTGSGDACLTLSGGGTVVVAGVSAHDFGRAYFV